MAGKARNDAVGLSSGLLQMRFMQRSLKKRTRTVKNEPVAQEEPEAKSARQEEGTVSIMIEPSYQTIQNLVFGRMSFKGFNPDVERVMQYYARGCVEEMVERDEAEEGSSREAEEAHSVHDTVARKFKSNSTKPTYRPKRLAVDVDGNVEEAGPKQFKRPRDVA